MTMLAAIETTDFREVKAEAGRTVRKLLPSFRREMMAARPAVLASEMVRSAQILDVSLRLC